MQPTLSPKQFSENWSKGDFFLDRDTHMLYLFDGEDWFEVVPSYELRRVNFE
jgi:hypothetical protein